MPVKAEPLLTAAQARVAVVMVNYRTPELAIQSIRALAGERRALADLEVIIVDGGSGDDSAEKLAAFAVEAGFSQWVKVLALPINGGFGWANNQAMLRLLARPDPPEFIHLLNPDTEIEPSAVVALRQAMLDEPQAGAVGSQLLEPDGSPSGSAFRFPSLRGEFARGARTGAIERVLGLPPVAMPVTAERTYVDWVTGASVMLRAEALRQIGLFDDGFFLYHEELEMMRRMAEAGWKIVHEPRSRVRHVGGAATGVYDGVTRHQPLPRKPAYWYESRRLYFLRSHGAVRAAVATAAWAIGHALWRARRSIGLARDAQPVKHEIGDQLRLGLPRRADRSGGPVPWDAPVDLPPAWMGARRDG
ncbi:glycosyltransferase family 2 protein [Sphingomonas mesophila]|uniref:glycosyltransferase family 2 protein n=1 Tax=Sphingomonas mesophila TaxID=2303576 RepID=UPI000E58A83F|nr:glycosyltransferase family 2 protein [Sphingomonas mesophila]